MGNWHHRWLALGLLAIVLLVGACDATQSETLAPGDATNGRSLWTQSVCMGCHGVNAEGSTGGPALAYTPLSLREVIDITRRGGPGMPKYPASQHSDQDLQDMYAWFRDPAPVTTDEMEQNPWLQFTCAGCHGLNAEGASASALAGTSLPFSGFETVVRQGTEGMPPFPESRLGEQALLAIYAWLQAKAQAPVDAPEPVEDLWAQSACAGCHGPDAGGASASALAGTPLPFSAFEAVVRDGARGMPRFSETQVDDRTLQAMYAWLQAQAPAPLATGEPVQDPWAQSACAGCHGLNAEGASASALAGTSQPFSAFETVVRQGTEGMPAFSESQLSDQTLQAIYAWLQAQAQVPAATDALAQDLWTKLACAGCHGPNAEGLANEELDYDEFQRVVRQGEDGMPAYSATQIGDTDLRRVYEWLMALP